MLKLAPGSFRFERFSLDPHDRQLRRDGAPVPLNARYFDALALLVREHGRLVSKDRFLDEVWRGVPVTEEALTQCIRTLRRQLGDDAARPRFIETAPKHGYRFVAPVEQIAPDAGPEAASADPAVQSWRHVLSLAAAGTAGGCVAGLLGGLVYGFAGASEPLQPGVGAISILLVLVCLTVIVALLGGAAVSFGIAAARLAPRNRGPLTVAGGAAGGLLIGAVVKLLGVDAFNLLFGRSPGDITGAPEGLVLGAALGLATWWAGRQAGPAAPLRGFAAGGFAGAGAGLLIALTGGRLLGGSLDLLAQRFPGSRLRLDHLGAVVGETGFGPVSQALAGALEGLLFGAFLVGAMTLARRRIDANLKEPTS